MPTAYNLRSLSDDQLAALAQGWRQRAATGEAAAAQIAQAFDAERLRREHGSTFDPLRELPRLKPWWKFW